MCINRVCVCDFLAPLLAGIQGPFQIRNKRGGFGRFPSEPGGFPGKDSGNIRNKACHKGTRRNITAAVINHTACLTHHPPATGHTVRVLLDYKSGEEDNRTEEGAIRFKQQISALFNRPSARRWIHFGVRDTDPSPTSDLHAKEPK